MHQNYMYKMNLFESSLDYWREHPYKKILNCRDWFISRLKLDLNMFIILLKIYIAKFYLFFLDKY